jgi:hypothetical protein
MVDLVKYEKVHYFLMTCITLFLSCNDSVVEDPLCECAKFKITQDFGLQEGYISIRKANNLTAYWITSKKSIYPWGDYFLACNDTIFENLIKIKQIKDSSMILFTGGIIADLPCDVAPSKGMGHPYPSIRVTSISLK